MLSVQLGTLYVCLSPVSLIPVIRRNIYITVTSWWTRWRLKSPASRLFTQSLIRAQIKENIKLRVTGLCAGNSPVTGEFPAKMARNAENVSIWWRHHERKLCAAPLIGPHIRTSLYHHRIQTSIFLRTYRGAPNIHAHSFIVFCLF